jgi:hypothetical protein
MSFDLRTCNGRDPSKELAAFPTVARTLQMTKPSRVPLAVWRALLLLAGLAALVTAATAQERQNVQEQPGKPPPPVNAQAAALQEFQTRMEQYLQVREQISRNLKPLSTAPDGAELTLRKEALAAAIRRARAKAKRGDLVPDLVAQQIAATVRNDIQQRDAAAQAGVFEEVPETPGSALLNRTYPLGAALPTVPPQLLMKLPKLPDVLQYRFVGRDMVILDADLRVVVDYVAGVLPVR